MKFIENGILTLPARQGKYVDKFNSSSADVNQFRMSEISNYSISDVWENRAGFTSHHESRFFLYTKQGRLFEFVFEFKDMDDLKSLKEELRKEFK